MDSAVLHAIAGRIRIRVPEIKGSNDRAFELESCLFEVQGISQVSVNPTTASALILFDAEKVSRREILDHLIRCSYLGDLPGESTGTKVTKDIALSVASMVTESALRRLLLTVF